MLRALQVQRGPRERQVLLVLLARPVLLAQQVRRVRQGRLVIPVRRDYKVYPARQVPLVRLALPVLPALPVVRPAQREPRGPQVQLVPRAQQALSLIHI